MVETTKKPQFFDITTAVEIMPFEVSSVFLVDMPGIGGMNISRAGYFETYGPGHFDVTFVIGKMCR